MLRSESTGRILGLDEADGGCILFSEGRGQCRLCGRARAFCKGGCTSVSAEGE